MPRTGSVPLPALALLEPAFAECITTNRSADHGSEACPAEASWRTEESTSGCDDVSVFFLLPIDHVASVLPSSFIERRPRGFEAHLSGLWTTSATVADRIGRVGHDIHRASVTNAVGDPPQASPVSFSIAGAEGALASLTGTAPHPVDSRPGATNTWHVTEADLLHLEVSWSRPRGFGQDAPRVCDIRPGSWVAKLSGSTDCVGQTARFSGAADDAYASAWTHFPGILLGGGGG